MNRTGVMIYINHKMTQGIGLYYQGKKLRAKILWLYGKCLHWLCFRKPYGKSNTPTVNRPYPKQFSLGEEVDDSTWGCCHNKHGTLGKEK